MNSNQILNLMQKYRFTLQVEDPAEFWTQSPDRYSSFVETYLRRVPDRKRLVIDLNIIPNRTVVHSSLPTGVQTGAEFAQMLFHAAKASGRVAVYAESTLTMQDFDVMDLVLASTAQLKDLPDGVEVSTPYTALVKLNSQRIYQLDGKPWPFVEDGQIIVPPGKHEITEWKGRRSFLDLNRLNLSLRSIQAELLGGERTRHGLSFHYAGTSRSVARLSRQPEQIMLDGKRFQAKPILSRGEWLIILPPGEHRVEIKANNIASMVLDIASLLSSYAIVILGIGCGAALILLYLTIRIRRSLHVWL